MANRHLLTKKRAPKSAGIIATFLCLRIGPLDRSDESSKTSWGVLPRIAVLVEKNRNFRTHSSKRYEKVAFSWPEVCNPRPERGSRTKTGPPFFLVHFCAQDLQVLNILEAILFKKTLFCQSLGYLQRTCLSTCPLVLYIFSSARHEKGPSSMHSKHLLYWSFPFQHLGLRLEC